MPIDIPRVSIRDLDRLVAAVPSPRLTAGNSVATVGRLTTKRVSAATVGRLTTGRRDATVGRLISTTSLAATVGRPLQYRPPRKAG